MSYQIVEQLKRHRTKLKSNVFLAGGIQISAWSNSHDLVRVECDHNTLSLYVDGGNECQVKTSNGWRGGGGPGRFCLMPSREESTWRLRAEQRFVHVYCSDDYLKDLAVKVWDKEPSSISLPSMAFAEDQQIKYLYEMFILNCDWDDKTNHLQMSSAALLLYTHLVRKHGQLKWPDVRVKGRLSSTALRDVLSWIDSNIEKSITISELSEVANLSAFHFAHLFKASTGQSPHNYVMSTRLSRAKGMVLHSDISLIEISYRLGFSSPGHFSNRFRAEFGMAPSVMRKVR